MKQNLTCKLMALACLATALNLRAANPSPAANGVAANPAAFVMEAASYSIEDTGYYLDKKKWLAINPSKNKTAKAGQAFPFVSGHYDVRLQAVGEEDGQSVYDVTVNDQSIGKFTCPLSSVPMEEGKAYQQTWKNVPVDSGDIIAVEAAIASKDGKEFSRARWSGITFTPADDDTRAAIRSLKK